MKPLIVSSGEPAGIGPDLCLTLAGNAIPLVVMGDVTLLSERAKQLGLSIDLVLYQDGPLPRLQPHQLYVSPFSCAAPVSPGVLNPANASYVLSMLEWATNACLQGRFSALVTAPVNKAVINEAGFIFTGHTEFLAQQCQVENVVMLLACPTMKVALITTHLPLKEVPQAITKSLIVDVITRLNAALKCEFGIPMPKIHVSGLNPHAGEGGYLGREELEVIVPALKQLHDLGIDAHGPFAADTMFTEHAHCDVFVAMYHDQGLAVLKYAGFGQAVNVTLGLPLVRTSVDHGTALALAGRGVADSRSLQAAVALAAQLAQHKQEQRDVSC